MMEEDFSDLQDSVEDQTVAGVEPSLSLGFALLEEDAEFADLVAMSLVQVSHQWLHPCSINHLNPTVCSHGPHQSSWSRFSHPPCSVLFKL